MRSVSLPGFAIGQSLLLTCAGCIEIEDSSFIPFGTMEDLRQGSRLTLKRLVSRLRYASRVVQQDPNTCTQLITGLSRSFKAIP